MGQPTPDSSNIPPDRPETLHARPDADFQRDSSYVRGFSNHIQRGAQLFDENSGSLLLALSWDRENQRYPGKTVVEVAKMMGTPDPADAALRLEADEHGQVSGIYFALSDDNVKMVMQEPWVASASA